MTTEGHIYHHKDPNRDVGKVGHVYHHKDQSSKWNWKAFLVGLWAGMIPFLVFNAVLIGTIIWS